MESDGRTTPTLPMLGDAPDLESPSPRSASTSDNGAASKFSHAEQQQEPASPVKGQAVAPSSHPASPMHKAAADAAVVEMPPPAALATISGPSEGERSQRSNSKSQRQALVQKQPPFDFKAFLKREWAIFYDMLKSSYLNWLLVVSPIAIGLGFAHSSHIAVFVTNFLALVPLALLLGDVTEHLADRYGDVVGGLLNATFGNVVEIVLAIQALRHGQYALVEMSLIGSILSNLLLVLGCCYIAGGYFHHVQEFNIDVNMAQMVLLFTATMALCLPTAANYVISDIDVEHAVKGISHTAAILMFLGYIAYLVFQLYTHPELCDEEDEDEDEEDEEADGEEVDEEKGMTDPEKPRLTPIKESESEAGQAKARTTSGRTPSGRPTETVRTASGKVMEIIRTASGRMAEMRNSNKVVPVEGRTTSGRTHSGRTGSGRTSNSRNAGNGSIKILRNEAGLLLTSQEIIELNRARRMSGRPTLPHEVVVAAKSAAKTETQMSMKGGSLKSASIKSDAAAVARSSLGAEEEEEEQQILSTPFALAVLAAISALVAIHCEFLTEVIQQFSQETGLSQPFICKLTFVLCALPLYLPCAAMIILPIAGNACEHLSAVFMAAKNRMNLALGIAVGSGLQICMLAIPFISLIGWFIDKPFLMAIDIFALFCTIISVVLTYVVIAYGKCNWVYSTGPIALYVIICVAYFYRNESVDV